MNTRKIFINRECGLGGLVASRCCDEPAALCARQSTGHSCMQSLAAPRGQDESAYPWQTPTIYHAMADLCWAILLALNLLGNHSTD